MTVLFILTNNLFGQSLDSLNLKFDHVTSKELLEFYRFEDIQYYKIGISGNKIKDKFFLMTRDEYWNNELKSSDTIANTKIMQRENGVDTLRMSVMAKKTHSDTVKFHFNFPGFTAVKHFRTTENNNYSLRNINLNKSQAFVRNEPINVLVYSLPYEDPNMPGYLLYCELSREGIPPEKWGEEFGVKHYIVFKFKLLE